MSVQLLLVNCRVPRTQSAAWTSWRGEGRTEKRKKKKEQSREEREAEGEQAKQLQIGYSKSFFFLVLIEMESRVARCDVHLKISDCVQCKHCCLSSGRTQWPLEEQLLLTHSALPSESVRVNLLRAERRREEKRKQIHQLEWASVLQVMWEETDRYGGENVHQFTLSLSLSLSGCVRGEWNLRFNSRESLSIECEDS